MGLHIYGSYKTKKKAKEVMLELRKKGKIAVIKKTPLRMRRGEEYNVFVSK